MVTCALWDYLVMRIKMLKNTSLPIILRDQETKLKLDLTGTKDEIYLYSEDLYAGNEIDKTYTTRIFEQDKKEEIKALLEIKNHLYYKINQEVCVLLQFRLNNPHIGSTYMRSANLKVTLISDKEEHPIIVLELQSSDIFYKIYEGTLKRYLQDHNKPLIPVYKELNDMIKSID